MKNKFYFLIFCLVFSFSFNLLLAQEISKEKALLYHMKVWNYGTNSLRTSDYSVNNKCGKTYLQYYAANFDYNNYMQFEHHTQFNEFERNDYWGKLNLKMQTAIQSLTFTQKFTLVNDAYLGEYSFSDNFFPINTDLERQPLSYDDCNFHIDIGKVINKNDFNLVLNMPLNDAKNFASRRTNSNGDINRKLFSRFTYSIINKQISRDYKNYWAYTGSNFLVYVYSIELFEDANLTQKLKVFYPNVDYFDKVHGVKIRDGEETKYFNDNWSACSKEGAKYYRIVNYANGKINGAVRDYYISGKLQMEGNYSGYYAEDGFQNGLFTWYYENEKKSEEVNYTNGSRNGKCTTWFVNGLMNEQVKYLNGKKEGCDFIWDETGEAKHEWGSGWKYFDFYNNGEKVLYNRDCPYVSLSEWEKTQSVSLIENDLNVQNSEIEYKYLSTDSLFIVGEWEGKGQYSGQRIRINTDKSCQWQNPAGTYEGYVELKDISDHDKQPPNVQKLISLAEQTVNKKITLYDKLLCLSMNVNNNIVQAHLSLFNSESKLYFLGGQKAYFEYVK